MSSATSRIPVAVSTPSRRERYGRAVGEPCGGSILRKMLRSIATVAKITLICLNIWVLAVVLVVSLGHWRVFDTENSASMYDSSHLVVMRELKEDAERKLPIMAIPVTNISEVESIYVPPGDNSLLFMLDADKEAPALGDKKDTEGEGGGGVQAMRVEAAQIPQQAAAAAVAAKDNAKKDKDSKPAPALPQPKKTPDKPAPAPPQQQQKQAAASSSSSSSSSQAKLKNMQHFCQQQHTEKVDFSTIPASKLSNIVMDEKHGLLYCQIPGVVLNEWRKLLLITTGVVNTTSPAAIPGGDVFGKYGKSLKKLSDITDVKQRAKILSTFKKVLFVRDPLERLLMMYYTKLKSPYGKYFHQTFGSSIIKKYRKGAKEEDIKAGSSVTFSEFINYIVDTDHEGKIAMNEHWLQYYKQCYPCAVDYNFVGSVEDAEKDTKLILQSIKADKKVKPPYIGWTKTLTEKEMTAAYKEVDLQLLKNLHKVYSTDYTLFGYKCPASLHAMFEKAKEFHDY